MRAIFPNIRPVRTFAHKKEEFPTKSFHQEPIACESISWKLNESTDIPIDGVSMSKLRFYFVISKILEKIFPYTMIKSIWR